MFDNTPRHPPQIPTAHPPAPRPCADIGRDSRDQETVLELIEEYSPQLTPLAFGHVRARIFAHLDTIRAHTPNLEQVRGMRILDVACGSCLYPDNNLGAHDPWMPRLLLTLGAIPVGLDLAEQVDERFESHRVDLLVRDSLAFLPSGSFDSYHIRAFPTKKVAQTISEAGLNWGQIRSHLLGHLARVLKPGCTPMRSFDAITDRYVGDNARPPMPPHMFQRLWMEDDF